MRHLQSVLCISLVLASVALGNTQPEVTNVMAVQRPHTALVDVTFDLFDADGDLLHVTLWYSLDGGGSWDHQCMTVWGDVGPGIVAGEGLSATWDAGVDLTNHVEQQFLIRVYADDGGGSGNVPEGFVYIPSGTFTMGSPEDEPQREGREGPQHQVTLTQGFYMSKYEVTEEWWFQVMGGTPTTSQLPKSSVSWDLAVQFCNALSAQEGLTPAYEIHDLSGDVTWHQDANGYRLPTEAEWEYACRATTTMAFNNNDNCLSSDTEANYYGLLPLPGCPTGVDHGARTVVGSFPANQWGLYDMHGNLFEWVWCGEWREYTSSPQVNPVHNVAPGERRMSRGGYWYNDARACRSAYRGFVNYPDNVHRRHGLRPVRSAP